jgi:hypothetical protein
LSAEVGWHRDRATAFYRRAAWLALTIALAGFFLTYSLPLARGTFDGPSIAHVHGALLFGWLGLVIVQTVLVRAPATHRRIGWLGLALALAVAVSTVVMGHNSATRAIERGDGPIALSGFMGSVTTPAIFLALVVTAIALRRRPQWHKRLIFVATVAILWPAWFRWRHFLPSLPRPEITLSLIASDLPILIAMARDRVQFGAVHPAYLIAGLGLIAEQTWETFAFDTPQWRTAARWLYTLVG